MFYKKWIIDEEYEDGSGHDNAGHYEELKLTDDDIQEAVEDHFYQIVKDREKAKLIYQDIKDRVDVEEAYAGEIAEYWKCEVDT